MADDDPNTPSGDGTGAVDLPDHVTVRHRPDRSRYEVRVGDRLAGFTRYVLRPGRVVFVHTEIDDAYEGQGLGSVLARGALDDVRHGGQRVVPLCPFLAGYIARHAEYDDLVDHEALAALEREP
jgi:predicted GNAT family acetyltransferase